MKYSAVILIGLSLIFWSLYSSAAPGPKQSEPQTASTPAPAANGPAKSLKDAFQAAVKRSETLYIQKENVNQAGETIKQAWGSVAPTITGTANWTHQVEAVPASNASNPNYFSDLRTSRITLDQPLFRGLKDFAGIRQSRYKLESQKYALQQAAKQLFADLSQAYFNVQAYASDVQNYQIEIGLYHQRIKELQHFLRIGRSKQTDLLTLQSNLSSLEAQLESSRGQFESARDVLAYITGWNRETPLNDSEGFTAAASIDEYLKKVDERPDVKSALKTAKASNEGVPMARAGHFPSVDLIGDYYYERPGIPAGVDDYDVQLTLTLPIFSGGVVQSQVRQAQSVSLQADLTLSNTRRLAEEEVRTLYDAYSADQKQVSKLDETVSWAKKNYEAEVRDYKNGLVTNLDVLTAMNTFQDSQRLLDHQRMQMRIDGSKLQAAVNERPEIFVTDLP